MTAKEFKENYYKRYGDKLLPANVCEFQTSCMEAYHQEKLKVIEKRLWMSMPPLEYGGRSPRPVMIRRDCIRNCIEILNKP